MPTIVLVAALAREDRLIGNGLELPWHIPEDLKHFKRLTLGKTILMGRRTFQSLVEQFGGPLPNRRNVVISHAGEYPGHPDIPVFSSPEAALGAFADEQEVIIGGGARIYAHFLPLADRLELTLIDGSFEGNVFFPPFEHLIGPVFTEVRSDPREGFRFVTYERRSDPDLSVIGD